MGASLLALAKSIYYLAYSIFLTWQMFLELNSKGMHQEKVQEKKMKSFCLVFPSSTKREIRHVHVAAAQRRLRNVQKRRAMHVQSCCFANLNLLLFCRSVCVAVTDSE